MMAGTLSVLFSAVSPTPRKQHWHWFDFFFFNSRLSVNFCWIIFLLQILVYLKPKSFLTPSPWSGPLCFPPKVTIPLSLPCFSQIRFLPLHGKERQGVLLYTGFCVYINIPGTLSCPLVFPPTTPRLCFWELSVLLSSDLVLPCTPDLHSPHPLPHPRFCLPAVLRIDCQVFALLAQMHILAPVPWSTGLRSPLGRKPRK